MTPISVMSNVWKPASESEEDKRGDKRVLVSIYVMPTEFVGKLNNHPNPRISC